jgi:hypothetical protein
VAALRVRVLGKKERERNVNWEGWRRRVILPPLWDDWRLEIEELLCGDVAVAALALDEALDGSYK